MVEYKYMDYELALKLRNAGFPQGEDIFGLTYPNDQKWCDGGDWDNPKIPKDTIHIDDLEKRKIFGAYSPTLSELIEECGIGFVLHSPKSFDITERYHRYPENLWTAYSQKEKIDIDTTGSTPEEAVANLYIKLNEK